jgi:hypothetical protein
MDIIKGSVEKKKKQKSGGGGKGINDGWNQRRRG